MNIKLLDLERGFYLSSDKMDKKEISKMFRLAKTTQLPIIQNNLILGLVDLLSFIESNDDNINIDSFIIEDFFSLELNDNLLKVDLPQQEIIPVISRKNIYLGYIHKKDLEKKIQMVKSKKDIDDCYSNKIQYYRDIKEEFDAIFESSYDGIHITDGNGITLRFNKACEVIDGIRKEKIIGKNMNQLVQEGIYSKSVALEVLDKNESITILQNVNGKEIMATGTPIFKDGKIFRIVINSRDITIFNNLKKELDASKKIQEQFETELELLRSKQMKIDNMVVKSPAMKKILSLALHIAKFDSTVLIQGESGVGKGVVSKLIHVNSHRRNKSFIKIDCSSIPENLLESELFGYVRGAFTGADKDGKIGLIELANEGTLFLDEIGELPLNLQVKLLRVIQDKEFYKIGGKKPIPVDIRIIAATNKILKNMVEHKQFRKDLYYRLNVLPINIPPLRERKEDIRPLIIYKLESFNKKYVLEKSIEPEALKYLLDYYWPGNVRELENIVERIIITSKERIICLEDLPFEIINYNTTIRANNMIENINSYKNTMDNFEKELLLNVKSRCKSTIEMSDILKLDPSTIRRKFYKHKIEIDY